MAIELVKSLQSFWVANIWNPENFLNLEKWNLIGKNLFIFPGFNKEEKIDVYLRKMAKILKIFIIFYNLRLHKYTVKIEGCQSSNFIFFSIEDAPHQISMRPSAGSHMCGGSIATNKHVITAAHCYYNPERLIVVAGNKNRNLVKNLAHNHFQYLQEHKL